MHCKWTNNSVKSLFILTFYENISIKSNKFKYKDQIVVIKKTLQCGKVTCIFLNFPILPDSYKDLWNYSMLIMINCTYM